MGLSSIVVQNWRGGLFSLIRTVQGTAGDYFFGGAVGGVGDLDNDGRKDFAISSFIDSSRTRGRVRFYSGATGNTLYEIVDADLNVEFGSSFSNVGDLNSDGTPDLAIGSNLFDLPSLQNVGRVQVWSGRSNPCGPTGLLLLQNQVVNTTAFFAARTSIRAGNAVAPPPYGDFVVDPTGDCIFVSGSTISLQPGFRARNAGKFSAKIDPAICP